MSSTAEPGLDTIRAQLARVTDADLRQQIQRVLVLWELGYLRQALAEFRLSAEQALRRIIAGSISAELRERLERALDQGQTSRVIERLYREQSVIPARVALHLHTLLAWGNYASHHQRLGHDARPSDLALLVSIAVDLQEWLATEHDGRGSLLDRGDLAWAIELAEREGSRYGLTAEVARALVTQAGPGVCVEGHRLAAPSLGLELLWRCPEARPRGVPYRGLEAFELEDADRFYGRGALRPELEQAVDTRWLTVISGASGSGKTSLLRAGLFPFLLDLGCVVLHLSDYGRGTLDLLQLVLSRWPKRPLALVLDQLERTFLPGRETARVLSLALDTAAESAGRRVVLSLREESLGRLLREAQPFDVQRVLQRGDALFPVGPLQRSDAREAILRPLDGSGLSMDLGLVEGELLSSLADPSGALPAKLQLVCSRLFAEAQREGRDRIDAELWKRLGGAERILSSYLDETLAAERYEGIRDLARALLKAMTQDGSACWARTTELWQRVRSTFPTVDGVQIGSVLQRLTDDRLIVSRQDDASGEAEHTLMHDQLAAAAQSWVSASELELQLAQERLDHALSLWVDPRRREILRGRGLRLVEVHWRGLLRTETEAAVALLAASRRTRSAGRLSLTLLLAATLFGIIFGSYQLRRATVERDRAVDAADKGVLLQALLALDSDPTLALAWLRNLSRGSSGVGLQTIIEEARRRGVALVLKGHTDRVTSVAWSRERSLLATASRDGTIRLWDLRSRSALEPPIRAHGAAVNRIALSPDERLLASASSDGTVALWDVTSRSLRARLIGHGGPVYGLCFLQDGQLASAGADHTVRLWAAQGQPRGTLAGHEADVRALACASVGSRLASGALDGTVRLWDAASRAQLGPAVAGHSQSVFSLAFSPDGERLASASRDGTARVWSVASGRELLSLPHADWVIAVAFSPDGRLLATAGLERAVRLWDAEEGREQSALRGHLGFVSELAFSADGRQLASASRDHTVRVWDLRARESAGYRLQGHTQEVRAVAFSSDGTTLASAGKDRSVRVWDVRTRRPRLDPLTHAEEVLALAFVSKGTRLVAAGENQMIELWQLQGAPRASRLSGGAGDSINAVAVSPDGRLLASAGTEGRVRLWGLRTNATLIPPLEGHEGAVYGLCFSPDGRILASAGADRVVRLWEVGRRQLLAALPLRHTDTILALAISPDGKRLASSSADGSILVWDLERRELEGVPLLGHRQWVQTVAFAPHRPILASGGSDGTVRLWDLRTHHQLGPPILGHRDWVYSVAFSPDGRTLASASGDRTVWLWQLAEPDPGHLHGLIDSLTNLRVSLDGKVELQ